MSLIKFGRNSDDLFPQFHLKSVLDDFFGDNFFKTQSFGTSLPAANIQNNETEVVIDLAVPGFDKQDLKIDLDDNILTISSEKKQEESEKKKNYSRREYSYSAFSRSFTLPENIDKEAIEAECKNGVLHIHIPKKALPKKQNKSIEIK